MLVVGQKKNNSCDLTPTHYPELADGLVFPRVRDHLIVKHHERYQKLLMKKHVQLSSPPATHPSSERGLATNLQHRDCPIFGRLHCWIIISTYSSSNTSAGTASERRPLFSISRTTSSNSDVSGGKSWAVNSHIQAIHRKAKSNRMTNTASYAGNKCHLGRYLWQ